MSAQQSDEEQYHRLTLDPNLYSLQPDESAFIKELTHIQDDEELKHHVMSVQKEAFQVSTNDCSCLDLLTQVVAARYSLIRVFKRSDF
jgi:hypothetical protein